MKTQADSPANKNVGLLARAWVGLGAVRGDKPGRRQWVAGQPWVRHWEFWLALGLGAFLRLWHIDLTQFVEDQRNFMTIAREAVLHGAIPITSVTYSISTYSPPLSAYLLMPFVFFGKDPLPAVISIALWNILGLALTYILALRYFGRRVAATAALLLATCGNAVNYSRFIWQPPYWPTLFALWAITLYVGCILGRRIWFLPNVILLALATLLHPAAAILLPVTIVALLLAPQRPHRREYAAIGFVLLLLIVPTIIWELVSRGYDLRLYADFFRQHGTFGLDVFTALFHLLGAPSSGDFGPASLYARFSAWYKPINILAVLLFAVGYLVLSAAVALPLLTVWREPPSRGGRWTRVRDGMRPAWERLRADAGLRAYLLLWLWVTLPPLSMLHFSTPPTAHYLLSLFPAAFIVAGIGVRWLIEIPARLGGAPSVAPSVQHLVPRLVPPLVTGVVVLLIVAQAAQTALYGSTLADGHFDAMRFYGYPLAEVQAADAQLGTLQRTQGAKQIFVITSDVARFQSPLDYLLVSEHPDRVASPDDCLLLPTPTAGTTLEVATVPGGHASQLLDGLPNAGRVGEVPMPGGAPFPVYRLQGAAPLLPDETTMGPVTFLDAGGNGLRLDAAARVGPELIRLRWTVFGSPTTARGTPWYRAQIQAVNSEGGADQPLAQTDCKPTRWQPGETLFTWLSVASAASTLAIEVRSSTTALDITQIGPMRLFSPREVGMPLVTLAAAGSAPQPEVTALGLTWRFR